MAASIVFAVKNVSARNGQLWSVGVGRLMASSYSSIEHLSKYSYWKNRYQQQDRDLGFDWFLSSEDILDFLINSMGLCSVGKDRPISYLDLGCGTSKLAGNIVAHSPTPVSLVLLDFVCEALQYQKQYMNMCPARTPGSSWQLVCADVMSLPFGDCSFNMAVDKGTMDALMKHSTKGHSKAKVMMSEVKRVITHGGRFLQISDEDPDTRLVLLEELAHTFCDINNSDALTDPKAAVGTQLLGASMEPLKDMPRCNIAGIGDREATHRNQMSSWYFKVIPSRWNREYFIFWADKL